jgi:hypothetical protein
MPRFTKAELTDRALSALEEVLQQAEQEPVEPTPLLRFALAYLANDTADRGFFDLFWSAATDKRGGVGAKIGRQQTLNASLNGIYLQVGRKR